MASMSSESSSGRASPSRPLKVRKGGGLMVAEPAPAAGVFYGGSRLVETLDDRARLRARLEKVRGER